MGSISEDLLFKINENAWNNLGYRVVRKCGRYGFIKYVLERNPSEWSTETVTFEFNLFSGYDSMYHTKIYSSMNDDPRPVPWTEDEINLVNSEMGRVRVLIDNFEKDPFSIAYLEEVNIKGIDEFKNIAWFSFEEDDFSNSLLDLNEPALKFLKTINFKTDLAYCLGYDKSKKMMIYVFPEKKIVLYKTGEYSNKLSQIDRKLSVLNRR